MRPSAEVRRLRRAERRNAWLRSRLPCAVRPSAGRQGATEAEGQPRELEEELRLENTQVFTTLLASGLADTVGEWDDKLENLACQFVKRGGCKLPWIKVQRL